MLGPFIGILWVLDMAVLKRRLSLAVVTPVCFVVAVFVGGYGVYRDFNAGFSSDRYLDEAIANAFGIDLLDRFAARFDNFDFLVWTIRQFPTKRQGYLRAAAHGFPASRRFREASCPTSRRRHRHS